MRFPTILSLLRTRVISLILLSITTGYLVSETLLSDSVFMQLTTLLAVALLIWLATRFEITVSELDRRCHDLSKAIRLVGKGIEPSLEYVSFRVDPYGILRNFRKMTRRLGVRQAEFIRNVGEQETVLSSLPDGVIAVDEDHRIIRINKSALELLSITDTDLQGRSLVEIVRNTQINDFVTGLKSSSQVSEAEILWGGPPERVFRLHGSTFQTEKGAMSGKLLVFTDITQLKKLELMRKDFVANVSHELKTPITAIKGCAETLLDGHNLSREDLRKFLDIIARHADRLNAIFEDLLSLSRIEEERDSRAIRLEACQLPPILTAAIESSQPAAKAKGISIKVEVKAGLTIMVQPNLIEQAIHNLVDNAVKYSENGGEIYVAAREELAQIVIEVRDQGCGIEAEHLSRIFERFYRVDKARSRKVGGTGLGLAIVKHIAQAHGGSVSVRSAPGKGSTFSLILPRQEII